MNITIECNSDYSPYSPMSFSANWQDDKFCYHVWLSLIESGRVNIEEVIYKNMIGDSREARRFITKRLDLTAAAHAKTLAEIKRIADYGVMLKMFQDRQNITKATDDMRAEAEKLNRLFDAYVLLMSSDIEDKVMMFSHAEKFTSY